MVNEGSSASAAVANADGDDGGSDVPIISRMLAILTCTVPKEEDRLPKKDIRVISDAIIIIEEE